MKASKRYKLTTTVQGVAKSQIWDSHEPLTLGNQSQPVLWVIERSADQLRVRQVSRNFGKVTKGEVYTLPLNGDANRTLEIGGTSKFSLNIVEAKELSAFYSPNAAAMPGENRHYFLAHLFRGQIIECIPFAANAKNHVEKFSEQTLFEIQWQNGTPQVRKSGAFENISKDQFTNLQFESAPHHVWILGWAQCSDQLAAEVSFRAQLTAEDLADRKSFRRSTQASASLITLCLGLFLFQSYIQSTQKKDEIPAQFAKIILKPALNKPTPPQASAGSQEVAANPNLPKKVHDAAVVKAFRAQTLQKSLKGLLKGGMTALLAKSDFAAGLKSTAQAKRLFDSKNEALKPTGAQVGLMNTNQVQVAALGGSGLNGLGLGKGSAGYGKGENAQVNGQGTSFVSAELKDSIVEEGLTKDQVGEVIHKHMSEVRYCYESAMIKRPDLEGKLMIAFTINGNGLVKASQIQSSTLPDPGLDQCVVTRLKSWKFPNPRGGVDVAVTYPFIFKTLGR